MFAEQTNSANITVFTIHVFVAVIVRLYQEDYTKWEWKKDRKEMEVKILCFKARKMTGYFRALYTLCPVSSPDLIQCIKSA